MARMAAPEGGAGAGNQVMRWRYGDVGDSNFAVHGRTVPLLVGLLFLVVVFVAVCLYLRWACRHRYTPDPEAAAASASSSSSSAAGAPASTPGLDAAAIGGLPVTLYRPPAPSSPPPAGKRGGGGCDCEDDDQQAAQCSICISALVAGEKVKALPPCGHCFHPDCVDAWLRSQASCPLCRSLLLAAAAAANPNSVVVVHDNHDDGRDAV